MAAKKPWQEPLVSSIDHLGAVLGGLCEVGTTVTATSPDQCNLGNGASTGNCAKGAGAKITCGVGNGR